MHVDGLLNACSSPRQGDTRTRQHNGSVAERAIIILRNAHPVKMADTSAQPSPSEQDSLFGSSRRTSAQGDATITADAPQKHCEDVGSMIVPSEDMDHEPNEIELQRNRDRFEVELEACPWQTRQRLIR